MNETDISGNSEKICDNCKTVYRIEWLKIGEAYNDFGHRYCPFSGMLTDEYANIGSM